MQQLQLEASRQVPVLNQQPAAALPVISNNNNIQQQPQQPQAPNNMQNFQLNLPNNNQVVPQQSQQNIPLANAAPPVPLVQNQPVQQYPAAVPQQPAGIPLQDVMNNQNNNNVNNLINNQPAQQQQQQNNALPAVVAAEQPLPIGGGAVNPNQGVAVPQSTPATQQNLKNIIKRSADDQQLGQAPHAGNNNYEGEPGVAQAPRGDGGEHEKNDIQDVDHLPGKKAHL